MAFRLAAASPVWWMAVQPSARAPSTFSAWTTAQEWQQWGASGEALLPLAMMDWDAQLLHHAARALRQSPSRELLAQSHRQDQGVQNLNPASLQVMPPHL